MKETFQVIEQMKRDGVLQDYAVAGAVGAIFYVQPFNTSDVDILVNVTPFDSVLVSLDPLFAYLRTKGYTRFVEGCLEIAGWPVQFLPTADALADEALKKAQYLSFDDSLNVRVVLPEYLAAEAVKVGRPKDLQRVLLLLEFEEFDRGLFEEIIEKYGLEERWQNVKSILGLGLNP